MASVNLFNLKQLIFKRQLDIWMISFVAKKSHMTSSILSYYIYYYSIIVNNLFLKGKSGTSLEERVNICESNSENLMKIDKKIRKLWNFEVSQIFKKHFLTSRYEYANERVDDVIASQFSIHTEMTKIQYFSYENVRLSSIPLWIDRIMLTPI